MSRDDELVERVRALRAGGCTAKQIARTVGVGSPCIARVRGTTPPRSWPR